MNFKKFAKQSSRKSAVHRQFKNEERKVGVFTLIHINISKFTINSFQITFLNGSTITPNHNMSENLIIYIIWEFLYNCCEYVKIGQ